MGSTETASRLQMRQQLKIPSTLMQYPDLKLYIGGAWHKSRDARPVLNPADESVIGMLPIAREAELDAALEAATAGFKIWSRTGPSQRANIILRASRLMRERIEDI